MKTLIWTLPTRIFHWLLAIGFVLAYIFADFEELNRVHFAFGAFVGSLVFFRIIFGLLFLCSFSGWPTTYNYSIQNRESFYQVSPFHMYQHALKTSCCGFL